MTPAPQNGNNVTWRELELALTPIKDGQRELQQSVDAIRTTLAENRGAALASKTLLDSRKWWIALVAGVLTSAAFAAIFTLLLRGHP